MITTPSLLGLPNDTWQAISVRFQQVISELTEADPEVSAGLYLCNLQGSQLLRIDRGAYGTVALSAAAKRTAEELLSQPGYHTLTQEYSEGVTVAIQLEECAVGAVCGLNDTAAAKLLAEIRDLIAPLS